MNQIFKDARKAAHLNPLGADRPNCTVLRGIWHPLGDAHRLSDSCGANMAEDTR